jgi:hypothetical protein
MANVKISDLTAYTDAASTDILPIVDIGNDVTKKITIGDVVKAVPLGTAALPGLAFDGDPNSGVYSPGADQVAISTSGTGRLFVDASGNVGVGTASPANILHLQSDAGFFVNLQRTGASPSTCLVGNSGNFLYLSGNGTGIQFLTGATPSERARIDSSGRLLVGTSTSIATRLSTTATTPGFQVRESGSGSALFFNGVNSANPATLYSVKSRGTTYGTIVQNNDSLFRISAAGDDGVQATEAARIDVAVDGTPGANDMPGRIVLSTTADGASSPTERLRITSAGVLQVADAGNITVGTTTGTKIGTATTQKLGFYNATPVVQPAAVADATTAVDVITQLNDLLAKLRTLGIIAT